MRRPLSVLALCCWIPSSCTLAKPLVGAVTGPIIILAHASDPCGCDPRGFACAFAALAAVGAAGGLVTGIISDVQALSGAASDPCANWYHPFLTNTSPVE